LPEPTNDPAVASDLDQLARTVDVVIRPDGQIEEGVPGSHHPNYFRLPTLVPSMPPSRVLALVLDGGGRAALLIGTAEPYLAADLIDQVITCRPLAAASDNLHITLSAAPPPGFRLHAVTRTGSYIRCESRPAVRELRGAARPILTGSRSPERQT
jgi:diaminohydroxyphosphoribosylaminopyrimidine deaminase/5-amino-6-(5-phosphoribosylamino)uracil reductase